MQTYDIIINEYQREMLKRVLQAAVLRGDMRQLMKEQPGCIEDNMLGEVELMIGMLIAMPEHETKHPGVTHGLCL